MAYGARGYQSGRGYSGRQGQRGGGFWVGRPEFGGAASNYDRWSIRPLTVARGDPKATLRVATALGVAGKELHNYARRGGAEGMRQRMEEGGEHAARGWDVQEAYDERMAKAAQRGRGQRTPQGTVGDTGDEVGGDTEAPYGRDPFGDPNTPILSYEEGMKPAQQDDWEPPF